MNNTDFQTLVSIAKHLYNEAEKNAAENPSTPKIQVVIVDPFKKPYKMTISNDIDHFYEIVGGNIETVFIGEIRRGIQAGLIVNEEWKLLDLPFNRRLFGHDGHFDMLVGTAIITAYNMQGQNISLTDQEADRYIKRFTPYEVYI